MTTEFELLAELHGDALRQGPGSEECTRQALSLTRLPADAPLRVADIGCGTGASTLVLAQALPQARFLALDFLPSFLQRLGERAQALGVAQRIHCCHADMRRPPIAPGSLDLLWSEGAIYHMAFPTACGPGVPCSGRAASSPSPRSPGCTRSAPQRSRPTGMPRMPKWARRRINCTSWKRPAMSRSATFPCPPAAGRKTITARSKPASPPFWPLDRRRKRGVLSKKSEQRYASTGNTARR